MAIAEVEDVRELDQHCPRHALACNLPVARRFESILQDGYDPATVRAKSGTSLLKHVAGKKDYRATAKTYHHALWDHLALRTPPWPQREAWLIDQLGLYRVLRVEPIDEFHAVELGLIPDRFPVAVESPPLDLDSDRFASLDGLLLLLLLYREAQDAAHLDRARRLKVALHQAALGFAGIYQYRGEVLDTWRLLIESRMVAWDPHPNPRALELGKAQAELRGEHADVARSPRRRGPIAPDRLKPNTRSERRWRRRVWVRACCLYFDRVWQQPNFDYRDACPLFGWVVAHRTLINAQRARAIDVLMECDDGPTLILDPLIMPAFLYERRQRPLMSEAEWTVFGTRSIYDVIPVVGQQTSKD